MKIKSILNLSLLSLKRRKLRTFLTTLGVSVAIGMLFFLLNTAESIKGQINNLTLKFSDATRLEVSEKYDPAQFDLNGRPATTSATKRITDKTIDEMKKIPNVRGVYPNLSIPYNVEFLLSHPKESTSTATFVSPTLAEDESTQKLYFGSEDYMKEGEFFKDNEKDAFVVGEALAKILKIKIGSKLRLKAEVVPTQIDPNKPPEKKKTLGEFEAEVIGIAKDPKPFPGEERAGSVALMSFSLGKKLYEVAPVDETLPKEFRLKPGEYSRATVFVDSIDNVRKVEEDIKNLGYDTISVFGFIDSVNIFFLIIQGILSGFSLIGIIIALIGISNTMFMSVLERTKEIGIFKALGAKDKDIQRLFITESAAFGFFGALLGITVSSLFGFVVAFVANIFAASQLQQFAQGAPPEFAKELVIRYTIDPKILILTLVISTLLAIVAGLIPARRASRLDPIKALKYE